jgi:hypothetical protein
MNILESTNLFASQLSNWKKLALVLAGYAAAFLLTSAATWVVIRLRTAPPASDGMQAFGDMLLYLGLLAVSSVLPTLLALYFLRPFQEFWTVFSIAAIVLAALGLVAESLMGANHSSPWAAFFVGFLGLLIILGAPLLGLGFLAFAWLAPEGRSRLRLIAAASIEFAVCAYAIFCLTVLRHWPS